MMMLSQIQSMVGIVIMLAMLRNWGVETDPES